MSNPRRQRVVHVSRGLDMGGQERLLVEFARGADRERFELHFLSLTTKGVLAGDIAEHGWPVSALNQPEGLRPGMIWALSRFLREGRFDIVHTHDDKPLIYAAPAARLAGIARVIHSHHHGPVAYIQSRQLALLRFASLFVDQFVCVSRDSKRYLAARGIGTRKLLTLHNGIDLTRFRYQNPNVLGPAVCVARLSPEKDIANLLHAVAALAHLNPDFRLEIAGDGPLREDLHRLAAELQVTEAVRFLGEVRDIPTLLGQARLFVLPSKTEGISLTVLEAMARGLPVITTRVGGNPEVVEHERTGLLVPSSDPMSLSGALTRLWNDGERGRTMGFAGRKRVEDKFNVKKMIEGYEGLYLGKRP